MERVGRSEDVPPSGRYLSDNFDHLFLHLILACKRKQLRHLESPHEERESLTFFSSSLLYLESCSLLCGRGHIRVDSSSCIGNVIYRIYWNRMGWQTQTRR